MSAAPVPPATVSPPPGHPRFPHVDGLRAVAALAVVAVHVSALSGVTTSSPAGALTAHLNVGVAVFFVISGFLLYRPFAADAHSGREPRPLREYARRRALRIVPAYWLALTALAIYPGLSGVFGRDWWIYYGFGQAYSIGTVLGGIPPAWTLCIEVTFYALLPLYALALRRAGLRADLLVLAGLAGATLVLRAVLHTRAGNHIVLSTLPGMFDWFAAGMAMAIVSVALAGRDPSAPPPRPIRLLRAHPWAPWLLAGALFVLAAVGVGAPRTYDGEDYSGFAFLAEHVLYAAVAVALVAPAVFGEGERGPRRLLALPAVAWLGLVSYGIYLWHVPLLSELRNQGLDGWPELSVVGLAVTVACAAASFYALERPLLRRGGRRAPRVAGQRVRARSS